MKDLLAQWRTRADGYDTAAKGYNRKCVSHKGVQLTLRAKELRRCIEELEQSIDAESTSSTPPAGI